MAKQENERKIATKNYVALAVLGIFTIFATLYICKWINIYKEEKLMTSPLTEVVSEIYLSELSESILETDEAIIYFGYTNDKDNYELEEKILKEIKNKGLNEYVFYVNVKDYLENKEYEKMIKDIFPELENKNLKAPLLVYTKRATPIKIKSSNKKLITVKDFNNLANILETE